MHALIKFESSRFYYNTISYSFTKSLNWLKRFDSPCVCHEVIVQSVMRSFITNFPNYGSKFTCAA